MINRAASRHSANDGNISLFKLEKIHLAVDVLILPHNDGGAVLPKKENIVVGVIFENIFLKGLIEKRSVQSFLNVII